jgi:hypothetical protein
VIRALAEPTWPLAATRCYLHASPQKSEDNARIAAPRKRAYRAATRPVTFVATRIGALASSARTLREACRRSDSAVRESNCASPRTQDGEGRFAAHRVVVNRRAFGEAPSNALPHRLAGSALDDASARAPVPVAFVARRIVGCPRHGHRRNRVRWRVSRRRAELRRGGSPLDDHLHSIGDATRDAVTHRIPGAHAVRGGPAARHRDGRQPRRRDRPLLASSDSVRTVRSVDGHRPRNAAAGRSETALGQPLARAPPFAAAERERQDGQRRRCG